MGHDGLTGRSIKIRVDKQNKKKSLNTKKSHKRAADILMVRALS